MNFFGGIRQRIRLMVMSLLVLITVAVTWSAVWVIRRNTYTAVSDGIVRDARAFKLLHDQRALELYIRTRFLAAEPKIIAALGTPDIDRATLQFMADELRVEVELDLLMIRGLDEQTAALSLKGGGPDNSILTQKEFPGSEGGYVNLAGRDVHAVSAPVVIGGTTIGLIAIGDFVSDTSVLALKPLISSDIILCAGGDGASTRPMAATIRTSIRKDILEAVMSMGISEHRPSRASLPPLGEDFLLQSVSMGHHHTGIFLKSLSAAQAASWQVLVRAVLIAGFFLIVSAISVNALSGAITRPIHRLMEGTESIASGNLDTRTDIQSPVELRRLSQSFNIMAERIKELLAVEEKAKVRLEERVEERTAELLDVNRLLVGAHHQLKQQTAMMIRYEKMASIGTLSAGLAHEINNPLTVILGRTQLFAETLKNPNERKIAETIYREARRCADIVQSMMTFAQQESPRRAPSDLHVTVDLALELVKSEMGIDEKRIVREYDPSIPVILLDETLMQQVILNVVSNAFQAMHGDPRPERRLGICRVSTAAVDGKIKVRVTDSGPGMPADVAAKIFDPFFTTKEVGKGRGLGMSVALGIVEQHGGRIYVERSDPTGTTITVELPIERS